MKVWSIPLRTRFRGITVREGVLIRGAGRLGRVEPVPGVRRRRGRALAALRRGGGRRRLAGAACATSCRSTSPCPPSTPSGPTRSCCAGGCRTAKVKVAEPGQSLGDDHGPGRGGARRPRPDGPDPGRRQRRLGRRRARSRAIRQLDRAAGGLEYVEQPCATRRGAGRRTPRGRRADRGRRVDPPGRRPLPRRATSRPPTSPCSRCSRSAGCAPACGSPRTSGCPSSSRRRSRPRSASPPGVALAAALPELPYACGLATVQLLTDDVVGRAAAAGRRRAAGRPAGASTRRARPARRRRRTGSRTGRPGWPRCRAVRQDRVSPSTQPVDRRSPAPSSTRWSRPASPRSCSRPGSRNAPLAFAAYDAAAAGLLRLHTRIDERTAGFLALGLTKGGAPRRGRVHLRHRGRQPAPGRARGRARRRAAGGRDRRPAGPAARHRRQPDHRPGRHLRPAGPRRVDVGDGPPDSPTVASGAAGRCTSTSQLDDAAGPGRPLAPPPPVATEPVSAERPRPAARRDARRSARARSWSPATTPARRRGCSPQQAGWPLLAEPTSGSRTGANALRSYRLLLDGRAGPTRSSGSSSSATPPCPGRCTGCWLATTSRWSRCRRAAAGPSGRSPSTAPCAAGRRRRRRRPGLARARGRPRTPRSPARLDRLLAAEDGLTPYEVAGAVSRAVPPERPARRRRLEPDPRPRPDGRAVRRRRAAAR